MKLRRPLSLPLTLALLLGSLSIVMLPPASAHGKPAPADFRGNWSWAIYGTHLDEIPPGYKAKKLTDVPRASLNITIHQRGKRLSGTYGATSDFLGRVEEGTFTATGRAKTVLLHLGSGFGGTITARLTRRGQRLFWQVITSHGEEYFPLKATLHRASRPK